MSRRQGTRDALIAAGLPLFGGSYSDAVGIHDILQAAGISKQTFYNHFTDKAALLKAIHASIRVEYRQHADRVNLSEIDSARRMARALCAHASLAMQDPGRGRFISRTLLDDLGTTSELNCGIVDEVSLGLAQGRLSGLTLESGVCYTMGVTQALIALLLTSEEPARAIETVQRFAMLLLRGFGVGQPEAELIAGEAAREIIGRADIYATAPTA